MARQDPSPEDAGLDLDAAAETVENALVGAIHRDLRRQDKVALAFSGGLDSTILAAMLGQYMDGDVFLVTVGAAGSADTERARRAARFLQLPLVEATVSPATLARDLPTIVELVGPTAVAETVRQRLGLPPSAKRVSPVLVGVASTLFTAFREARPHAQRVLLGQGADELFGGYKRYLGLDAEELRPRMARDLAFFQASGRPAERRLAEHHGVAPRYPYLDEGVVRAAEELPVEALVAHGVRKRVLRRVAERLGLPADMAGVEKRAAQYGSGVAVLLRSLARRASRSQHEWLEAMWQAGRGKAPAPATEPAADR